MSRCETEKNTIVQRRLHTHNFSISIKIYFKYISTCLRYAPNFLTKSAQSRVGNCLPSIWTAEQPSLLYMTAYLHASCLFIDLSNNFLPTPPPSHLPTSPLSFPTIPSYFATIPSHLTTIPSHLPIIPPHVSTIPSHLPTIPFPPPHYTYNSCFPTCLHTCLFTFPPTCLTTNPPT
jgi:hypothetical protein